MPVVAAAPENITPLIKRLRVSLEFTNLAPFYVIEIRRRSANYPRGITTYITA